MQSRVELKIAKVSQGGSVLIIFIYIINKQRKFEKENNSNIKIITRKK